MSRHILDRQNAATDEQVKAYVDIDRANGEAGPHEATKTLQRRSRATSSQNLRAQAYLRADHRGANQPL